MPLNHVGLTVKDLAASREFYLTVLAPLKYKIYMEDESFVGMSVMAPDFWLFQVKKGESVTTGSHVAFDAKSNKQVDAFYAAAIKAGAKDNGPPGYRAYTDGYYAAYVIDPDGNNIEFVFWNPMWMAVLKKMPWVVGAGAVGVGAWFGGYLDPVLLDKLREMIPPMPTF